MQKQMTLAGPVSYSGNGLHSGKPVTMTLRPAAPDTGIVFVLSLIHVSEPTRP